MRRKKEKAKKAAAAVRRMKSKRKEKRIGKGKNNRVTAMKIRRYFFCKIINIQQITGGIPSFNFAKKMRKAVVHIGIYNFTK